ncbi:hypothetical protein [Burkholderia thailandensis]|nr:hypothetical protein [Burkholderia thailandensis]MDW9241096.1 hypothetical protein [Burkholderia thailandensis]
MTLEQEKTEKPASRMRLPGAARGKSQNNRRARCGLAYKNFAEF